MCQLVYVVSAYAFWVCPTDVNMTNCSSLQTNVPSPTNMYMPSPSSILGYTPSSSSTLEPSSSSQIMPSPSSILEPSPSSILGYTPSPSSTLEPSPSPSSTLEPSPSSSRKFKLKNPIQRSNTTILNSNYSTDLNETSPGDSPSTPSKDLRILHVLWTIPITGILLLIKIRTKSAQIRVGWQGRKMKRSQSWHGISRRKSPISSRWRSEPMRASDFDGINEIP